MHSIVITEFGGPDVLRWTEVAEPELRPGEVLVDVVASGVNRADVLQREGNYPPPPGASDYPGLEVSGVISAVTPEVTDWSVGQPVCALVSGGGYAQSVAVPQTQLLPVAEGVSLEDAAGLPEIACTTWLALVDRGRIGPGDTVLIHGGASGVGTFAIQLAKCLGATVFATASSPAKLAACRELGASETINYRTHAFDAAVQQLTDGRGVDVIIDVVGGSYLQRNVESLAANGRLVIVGAMDGYVGTLDVLALVARRASILSLSLRRLPLDEKAAVVASAHRDIWPLVEAGKLRPVIQSKLKLSEAAEAHRALDGDDHIGKILLINEHHPAHSRT